MKRSNLPVPTPAVAASAQLRGHAEVRLNGRHAPNGDAPPAAEPQRLLHELQVHQIELEMQNEELRKARDEMEAGMEKYNELYDFAPVGYLTLDRAGAILEANLAGAALLGIPRAPLMKQQFGFFVAPADRPGFKKFFQQVFDREDREDREDRQECEVRLLVAGKNPVDVRIRANRFESGEACRLAVTNITVHKQAEDRLRVSEIRYRRLFEAAHDGVLLLDPVTRKITDANPFMTTLLGYPRDELIGKELFEIGLLKDEPASREMFQRLKRQHEIRYEDLPLESRDGRHQEVEVVANLYQENGQAVIQCNIRDITVRKLAEQALRTSEERYRNLFNSIDEGFCVVEMLFDRHGRAHDYRFLSINPSFEKQSGIQGGVGKRILEIIPHLESYWLDAYGGVALTGKPGRFTNEAKAMNRWFDVYAFRIGDPKNRHVAILFRNITERKRTEEMSGRLAAIVESSADAITGTTLDGVVTSWNPGARRLYGHAAKAMLGRSILAIIPPERRHEDQELMQRIRRGEIIKDIETLRLTRGGRLLEVSLSLSPVRDSSGTIIGTSEIVRDISARKRAVATQQRAERLAFANAEANKEIARRRKVEAALTESEGAQRALLVESRELHTQLRHLTRKIITVQEDERKAISRELHDDVLQTLVGINVELGVLGHGTSVDLPALKRKIARTQRVVTGSIAAVHRFARDLRPAVLDDFGLFPALQAYGERLTARSKLRIRLIGGSVDEKLDLAQRTVLFRVAQEALTNVARHAHASQVTIRISRVARAIRMEISDNGRSFPVMKILRDKHPKRLGLVGMKERIEMAGGKLAIASSPGKGTLVRAEIPS